MQVALDTTDLALSLRKVEDDVSRELFRTRAFNDRVRGEYMLESCCGYFINFTTSVKSTLKE